LSCSKVPVGSTIKGGGGIFCFGNFVLLVDETVVLGVVLIVEVVVGLLVVVGMGGTKSAGKRSFSLFSLIVVLFMISLVFTIVVDAGVDSLVILTRVSENRGCSVFVAGLNVRDKLSLSAAVPFVLV